MFQLGAFGFLAGDEVYRKGSVNAGLLDQHFGLQWVQNYVHLFGGDASKVTISGQSAGAGAVMLQGMAYGGTLGQSLFRNVSERKSRLKHCINQLIEWIVHCSLTIFAHAVWLQRLAAVPSVLCLCNYGWLCTESSIWRSFGNHF